MIIVEIGNGKTRFFRDVIEYLEYTEKYGMQGMIADDIGSYIDPVVSNLQLYSEAYKQIEDIDPLEELPPIPDPEWDPNQE